MKKEIMGYFCDICNDFIYIWEPNSSWEPEKCLACEKHICSKHSKYIIFKIVYHKSPYILKDPFIGKEQKTIKEDEIIYQLCDKCFEKTLKNDLIKKILKKHLIKKILEE